MRKWMIAAALSLALMPAAAMAQENGRMNGQMAPGMRMGGMGMMSMHNPAEFVLNHQKDLNLTPDQLKKIGKIRDEFQHENGEALSKMDKDREEMIKKYGPGPYTEDQREAMRKDMGEHREQYAKLFENRRKAMDEIRETLSPSQQTAMQQVMRNEAGRTRDRDDRPRDRDRDNSNGTY